MISISLFSKTIFFNKYAFEFNQAKAIMAAKSDECKNDVGTNTLKTMNLHV